MRSLLSPTVAGMAALMSVVIGCASTETVCVEPEIFVDGFCRDLCAEIDCNDENDCTSDECALDVPQLRASCVRSDVPDGMPCATLGGSGECAAGVCEAEASCDPPDCDDRNQCTIDGTCNETLGICQGATNAARGAPCQDDKLCDGFGECVECLVASDCDSVGECTVIICAGNACTSEIAADGTPCDFNGGPGECSDGACVEPTCDPPCVDVNADDCFQPYCPEGSTICSSRPVGTGFDCDLDGEPGKCNDVGLCVECVGAENCNDGNECSLDLCDSDGICRNTPRGGSACTAADGAPGECVGLVCAAFEPEIEVLIEGVPRPNGARLEIAETVEVGADGNAIQVTIRNVGDATLSVTSVSGTGGDVTDFSLATSTLESMIGPGSESGFGVRFTPLNGGIKNITVTIRSNDSDETAYQVSFDAHTKPNSYRDLNPSGAPPARFNTAMVDLRDGRVLMFGGRDASGTRLDDTWIYEVDANAWTELNATASPPKRDAHAMAYASGRAFLFGGNNGCPAPGQCDLLQDMWEFVPQTSTWSQLQPSARPPALFQHGMTETGPAEILLFGGRNGVGTDPSTRAFDTWLYDADANTWTNPNPTRRPNARWAFAIGSDGVRVTIFGGFVDQDLGSSSLTYTYPLSTNTWLGSTSWEGLAGRGAVLGAYYENAEFIVFSGKPATGTPPASGTFSWNPDSEEWTTITPLSEPPPRFNYGLAHIVGKNKAIIFSGLGDADNTATLADTVEYVAPRP